MRNVLGLWLPRRGERIVKRLMLQQPDGGKMLLRGYQWAELIGILFLLASTATQIFYVDPLRREIEWRMATFSMQQTGQVQLKAIYEARISTLRALKVAETEIARVEAERDAGLARFTTADANISDFLQDKQPVEDTLQLLVIALFGIGSLLAGFGRAMEMVAGRRID